MLEWRVVLPGAILVAEHIESQAPRHRNDHRNHDEADDLSNAEALVYTKMRILEPDVRSVLLHQSKRRARGFVSLFERVFSNEEKAVGDWWHNLDCYKPREFYFISEVVTAVTKEADLRLFRRKKLEEIPSSGYKTAQSSRGIKFKDGQRSVVQFFGCCGENTRHNGDVRVLGRLLKKSDRT